MCVCVCVCVRERERERKETTATCTSHSAPSHIPSVWPWQPELGLLSSSLPPAGTRAPPEQLPLERAPPAAPQPLPLSPAAAAGVGHMMRAREEEREGGYQIHVHA